MGRARFLRNSWFGFSPSALHDDFFFFFFLLFICLQEKLIFRESLQTFTGVSLSLLVCHQNKTAINLFFCFFTHMWTHLNVGLVRFCSWLKKCFQSHFGSVATATYTHAKYIKCVWVCVCIPVSLSLSSSSLSQK